MSLTLALNNALTGLEASQKALAVISHNVSNANTENYSRQELVLASQHAGGVGMGVNIEDVIRKADIYLEQAIQRQTSEVGRTSIITDYMDQVQILMGEPGADNSIDEYIETFFNDLQSLAETPDSVSAQEVAVDAGIFLAREVSSLAKEIEDLRYQADEQIEEAIRLVNEELRNLDTLNTAIAQAKALGNPTASLEDNQAAALERISEYLKIQTYNEDNGVIHIFTEDGKVLLDTDLHELRYQQSADVDQFINGDTLNPIEIYRLNDNDVAIGAPVALVSGGVSGALTHNLIDGRLAGLLEIRDDILPQTLEQLDRLANNLRDAFNAIHNDGSSYPGINELTGTRAVTADTVSEWTGTVRIAVLDDFGSPVGSGYSTTEDYTGYRPLDLDLSFLDSGFGAGQPEVQTIIDEINNHFFPPPVKTVVGNLANIQMVSDTVELPQGPASFSFDFDLENISAFDSEFYVTNITVLDSTGADITNVTTPPPEFNLNAVNTYTTTNGSDTVTIAADAHGLTDGDRVYLNIPTVGPVNGIPAASLNGFFEVSNAGTNTFEITVNTAATATGSVSDAGGVTGVPPWDTIAAGEKARNRDAGIVDLDLTGNASSAYYDITVNVGVDDRQGSALDIAAAQVTYRIYNFRDNLFNDRYNSTAISGTGERVVPNTDQPYLQAMLVDENGDEIPSSNGVYFPDVEGFLTLVTNDPTHTVAIEELDSQEQGISSAAATADNPARDGTNRGFSHYFELNNFFASNEPTNSGDTLKNSAINLAVENRFLENSSLFTLGTMELSNQPADPNDPPLYTRERYISNNSSVQRMAGLGLDFMAFAAAGGISDSQETFLGYASSILAYGAAQAVRAESENDDSNILLDGYVERADAVSGVNIDEEMANTIIYQNAYTASARVISTTNEMFDDLLGVIN